jgi:hypothetical protein
MLPRGRVKSSRILSRLNRSPCQLATQPGENVPGPFSSPLAKLWQYLPENVLNSSAVRNGPAPARFEMWLPQTIQFDHMAHSCKMMKAINYDEGD